MNASDLSLTHLQNTAASHDEILNFGRPANPTNFPNPQFSAVTRVNASVRNPATGETAVVTNVFYEVRPDGMPPSRAYWIGRTLRKAIFGCVRSCTVLRLREGGWAGPHGNSFWEITPEMAAVKIIDLRLVREYRGRHIEDPIKEVAAMQFLCRNGAQPNVLPCWDLFRDERYIYLCMPFCSSGELFGFVERSGRFEEPLARFWFGQLLNALYHMQKNGVCHRDLSLENILVDENTKALVIDLGMCIRIPYNSQSGNQDEVVDVSEGTLRKLIYPQGQCGKPNYISPEILENADPFDGFAVDVWAAGVVLFIMLVGLPPFELASRDDPRFRLISRGGLHQLVERWQRPISPDAIDLLQNMLRENPRDRLSLFQVMNHPWCRVE
ncbi:serine/threonine-protein kinase [Skeletonema marinoi]|uniref:Serine/threonine-protein kinase n=1 Tax=Skeletonema marinoi TaxID=267567 RepID=A0AAD8YEH5_9STRA|nr:serine/threonine-protein kinase [Skeletonema marinoi]